MATITAPTPSNPAVRTFVREGAPWRTMVRKILLACGVLSSLVYVGAEVYAWSQYPGYSPVAQAFSELLAEGAPTRALMVAVAGAPYNLLVAALGVGVWLSPARRRVARLTGALLVLYALLSYLGGTVFQMDPRGVEGSVRTLLHERATAVMVLAMLLALGAGAFLHGRSVPPLLARDPPHRRRLRRADVPAGRPARRARAGAVAGGHRARRHLRLDALGGGAGPLPLARPRGQRPRTPGEASGDAAAASAIRRRAEAGAAPNGNARPASYGRETLAAAPARELRRRA